MPSPHHTKYWAHELTLRGATGTIESLSRSIAGARVDLNPHQVDAALFALRSPLARGVILADEVGLGKTIEASLVIAQRWAERRRRTLLIVPAMLRTQWSVELESKFFLPTRILDARVCADLRVAGVTRPFDDGERVLVCSYQFAAQHADEVASARWDLVVVDEAHRLRNVYRPSSRTARAIVDAIHGAPKLLLTATPLQNSLMELFGLASVIDEHVFGDADSFREQFVRAQDEETRNEDLRRRLRSICVRTLRRQVVEYIPFTRRVPVTQDFLPGDDEHELYERISSYLQREDLVALPASQRTLVVLVLRKLLASSTFAIANTLDRLVRLLEGMVPLEETVLDDEDLEGVDELADELEENRDSDPSSPTDSTGTNTERGRIQAELSELREFARLARTIGVNAKGEALVPALNLALRRAEELGAARKAVVFTESRRTQEYLFELLNARGFKDQVVLINGTNSDAKSREIYETWRARHAQSDRLTGSRGVDAKAALIDHFRDHATILIATEAAAEGVNLQFCSLVVNYDLPWNPQRIEQRIGRCHRYGQRHDVVVVNFLNRRNEADQRVLELLAQKFKLFDGVFGASDEVLGALESGVDIERRIARVYQTCRTAEEIRAAFDMLQSELDEQIQSRLARTREQLLEHFDEDVSTRLRVHRDKTLENLSSRERFLFELTRVELGVVARFEADCPRFHYDGNAANRGTYHLDWREAERLGDTFYRQDHPLAREVIERALAREVAPSSLILHYDVQRGRHAVIEPWLGMQGWITVAKLSIESFTTEEFLVFVARSDDGDSLDEETCRKLLCLPATMETGEAPIPPDFGPGLRSAGEAKAAIVDARNGQFFDEEVLKLDRWAEDLKRGLERELKELDQRIREARKVAALKQSLADKLEAQRSLKSLDAARSRKRRELFDGQDAIDARRDELIARIEKQLSQRRSWTPVCTFRWRLA
ncbi:MAG: DEAD/DEAH box helicase [Planctomycetes bacterium]|nr:DEAD/DEAH box helicase [Planctomycetota bacterium]